MPSEQFIYIALLVGVLSVVQSLFGVGLLVFGTPLLLLFGVRFEYVLFYLVPCSLIISGLQVRDGWHHLGDLRRMFLIWVAPAVVVGLVIALSSGGEFGLKGLVGGMLIFIALSRTSPVLLERTRLLLLRQRVPYLVIMGLLHGLTNMGGGLLTIFVNAIYKRKDEVRAYIAFGYLIMGIAQVLVLFSMSQDLRIGTEHAALLMIAAGTYIFLGNRLFTSLSNRVYYHAMTVMMFTFGGSLLISTLNLSF